MDAEQYIDQAKLLLADVERRILRHQAECLMSNSQAKKVTKIRADIKRFLGVIK